VDDTTPLSEETMMRIGGYMV
nr:RecName: Full=N-acetyl-D-galactosamine-binding lectin subunit B; AltName: Full=A-disaccharide-binding lectin subunit B [Iris x hollandica]